MGCRDFQCLRGKGQVKEMCLPMCYVRYVYVRYYIKPSLTELKKMIFPWSLRTRKVPAGIWRVGVGMDYWISWRGSLVIAVCLQDFLIVLLFRLWTYKYHSGMTGGLLREKPRKKWEENYCTERQEEDDHTQLWLHPAPAITGMWIINSTHCTSRLSHQNQIRKIQLVYLRSLIAISLPSRSLTSNIGITLSIPRIKTNTGARAFSSCAPSHWNNLPISVRSATSVASFRRRLKTPFRLGLLPVDTGVPYCLLMLLQRLRIWTPIWLLRHWAWLRRGYWRYRNLIDWLIDTTFWNLFTVSLWQVMEDRAVVWG